MFYKVWNATTKHIRAVLFQQKRPIELPYFAIFAPTKTVKPHTDKAPSEIEALMGNGSSKKLDSGKDGSNINVKLILHNDFITKCGEQLQLPNAAPDSHSGTLELNNVVVLSKSEGDHETVQSLFGVLQEQFGLRGLHQISFQSIAKACQTDATTVELILREIVATMVINLGMV